MVDTALNERLEEARARLRSAIGQSSFPGWFLETAQRCFIDLDCALAGGTSDSQARLLLAHVDALISAAGDAGARRIRRDDDPR